jgi:heptose I phosphotransferase
MLMIPDVWREHFKGSDVFDRLFAMEGKVYREQKGRKTVRITIGGKHYFAKMHRGVGWREIVKNAVRCRWPATSAKNEWEAIQRLEQLGIATTPLVACGKRGWNPARLESFVITDELSDTISLENFCRDWPTSPPDPALKRALITRVAEVARTLHENGINHRDFYICHFLLHVPNGPAKVAPNDLAVYLIDLHRVQIRARGTPTRWRVKDVAGLLFSSLDIGLSQRDVLRFMRVYSNKPLRVALRENGPFWRQVTNRAIRLYRKLMGREPTLPW